MFPTVSLTYRFVGGVCVVGGCVVVLGSGGLYGHWNLKKSPPTRCKGSFLLTDGSKLSSFGLRFNSYSKIMR